MPEIAITGSTGRLGGRVARALADRGVKQRLVVRDATRAPQLPGVEVAQASYADADASHAALQGISTVLMVSAAESLERVSDHQTFIDAAAASGVKHLVYISFLGARADATFTLARDHAATERHVRESGIAFTFLRDSLYADFLPGMVGHDGAIRGPAGEGRVSAVAQQDIADAATAVLTAPGDHAGRTYDLTGPEALTFDEIARTLTDATGRAISYVRETLEEAYASRAHYGAPAWEVDAWVSTYTAIAAGEVAAVSDAIPLLTGHPATTLAELLAKS
jgi:NAD(P)H dehydrogenase (quinone)